MEHETKMMCPFRRKESGDFEPCYGKGCGAYREWKSYQFGKPGTNSTGKEVENACCGMLLQPTWISGISGCNPVI